MQDSMPFVVWLVAVVFCAWGLYTYAIKNRPGTGFLGDNAADRLFHALLAIVVIAVVVGGHVDPPQISGSQIRTVASGFSHTSSWEIRHPDEIMNALGKQILQAHGCANIFTGAPGICLH